MKIKHIFPILTASLLVLLPACLGNSDNYNDYTEWRELNQAYYDSIEIATVDGVLQYVPITPVWDNSFTVLMHWHNDPDENPSYIMPLSTSTCVVKYTLTNIVGDTLDSSDSFTCVPNNMVTGFMAALTNMRVNDTVTAVVPYAAGYGTYGYSSILPYSTLIFGIRLDSISKLM
ncbi:MAG: FKBP-type peptidyl-prolyl cis-trans isomerase [Muribaculaceae bacterium]|nr:FKBP-type peptidyl-prolyl cis-trans isomerase [Muribaculaceae bacterium]